MVGGRDRKCRIARMCSPFFPWIRRSGVGHLSRGRGIESQVAWVTDAPFGEQVQRGELPQGSPPDLCTPFNGDVTRRTSGSSLCTPTSVSRHFRDLAVADMLSARAWIDLAGWIRALAAVVTMFPNEVKNKSSRKGKSRLRILMVAAMFGRFEWYMNNARIRTTLSALHSTLMASGTCGNEALRAELR